MLVRVDTQLLKKAFTFIQKLLKGKDTTPLISFTTDRNGLTITAANGPIYQMTIPCKTEGFFTVTVLFKNITELMTKGECEVLLTDRFVQLTINGNIRVTLSEAYSSVTSYKHLSTPKVSVNPIQIGSTVSALRKTSLLGKIYQTEAPILFLGETAMIKYNTFWIETKSSYLSTVMSLNVADLLKEFRPNDLAESDSVLEFSRDFETLAIPKVKGSETKSVYTLMKDTKEIGRINLTSVQTCLSALKKAYDDTPVTFIISPQGSISIDIQTDTSQLTIGEAASLDCVSFKCSIDIMLIVCSIFGEEVVTFYQGGNKICLVGKTTSIVMSVLT